VRLDGLPALGQLLVELLATGDRLLVQLRLEPGGLLGVLLEDALGLARAWLISRSASTRS
jgi:hypothetical protein